MWSSTPRIMLTVLHLTLTLRFMQHSFHINVAISCPNVKIKVTRSREKLFMRDHFHLIARMFLRVVMRYV